MGNVNAFKYLRAGRAWILLTPHGERERKRDSKNGKDVQTPNPSWGT